MDILFSLFIAEMVHVQQQKTIISNPLIHLASHYSRCRRSFMNI
jgi:hypothetical protein